MELSELHADLKIQERGELSWKKLKAEGLDEDGEKEAKLVHSLSGVSLPLPHGGRHLAFCCCPGVPPAQPPLFPGLGGTV